MPNNTITVKFGAETGELSAAVEKLKDTLQSNFAGITSSLDKAAAQSATAAQAMVSNITAMSGAAQSSNVLTQAINGVGSSMGSLGGPVGAAMAGVAGLAAALVGTAQAAANYEKEVHGLAMTTGASLQQASIFGVALKMIGKSAEEAEGMMFRMMRTMRTQPEVLAQIGVAAQNLDGSFRPLTDVFSDTVSALGAYSEGIDRDMASLTLFGKKAQEMTEYMRLTSDVMEEATKIANTWGLVVDEQGEMSALEYSKALNTLALEFKGVALAIGKEILPPLRDFVKVVTNEASSATVKLSGSLAFLAQVCAGVGVVWQMLDGMSKILIIAFDAVYVAIVHVIELLYLAVAAVVIFIETLGKLAYYLATLNPRGMFTAIKDGFKDLAAINEATVKRIEDRWKAVGQVAKGYFPDQPKKTAAPKEGEPGYVGPPKPKAEGESFDPTYYKREKDALDQHIAQIKATHTVSLQEEHDYWQARKELIEKAGHDVNPIFKNAVGEEKTAIEQAQKRGGMDSGQIDALRATVKAQVEAQKSGDKERMESAKAAVAEIVGIDGSGANQRLAIAMHHVEAMKALNMTYTASYRQIMAELATLDVGLEKQRMDHLHQAGEAQTTMLKQQQLAARGAETQGQAGLKWLQSIERVLPAMDGIIKKYSEMYGVSEQVVRSVLAVERGVKSTGEFAVSPKGAIGPGQLMPATAKAEGADPWNLDDNIKGSVKLLAELFQKFPDDLRKVFAAYNAGEPAVKSKGIGAAEPGYVDNAMGAMGAQQGGGGQVSILSQQVKLKQELAVTEQNLSAAIKERSGWQAKADKDSGNEEYKSKLLELDRTVTSLSIQEQSQKEAIEKEKLNLVTKALDDEQAKHKKGTEEYAQIERQKFALVKELYASDTEQYMDAERKKNAAERLVAEESLKIQREADAMVIDNKKAAIDMEKAQIEQGVRLGQITAAQKTATEMQLNAQFHAVQLQQAQNEMNTVAQTASATVEEKEKAYRKLLDLELQYSRQVQQSNNQLVMDYKAKWDSALQSVAGSMASAMQGMITGQENFRKAMSQVLSSILSMVLQTCAKWAANWLSTQLGMTAATAGQQAIQVTIVQEGQTAQTMAVVTGQAAQTAAKSAGASAGIIPQAAAMIKSIMASAAETFAGVFGFLSPVMGPAAAGPAAVSEGAVLAVMGSAGFAQGAWELPHDMFAQVHAGETIMPTTFAQGFRDAMENGGGGMGGSGSPNLHFHFPNDPKSFERQLRDANSPLMKQIKESFRNHNLRLR